MLIVSPSSVNKITTNCIVLLPRGAHARRSPDYLRKRSSIVAGPLPPLISVGPCFDPNGTSGGRNGVIPYFGASAMDLSAAKSRRAEAQPTA